MPKLTKTVVDAALPRAKKFTLWCSDLPGFGVYILPTGNRTYFVDYRNSTGVRRRLTIGRHGKLTTEGARKIAIATMGEVVKGEDPAEERVSRRNSLTVKELCDRYLEAAERGHIMGKRNRPKKFSTLYVDRGRISRHILPLLGNKLVRDVTQTDVNRFIRDVAAARPRLSKKRKRNEERRSLKEAKEPRHGRSASLAASFRSQCRKA
jgi:hypothetical protein